MLANNFKREIFFNKSLSRIGAASLKLPDEQKKDKVKPFVKWVGGKEV